MTTAASGMIRAFEASYKTRVWGQGSGPGSAPEGLAIYLAILDRTLRRTKPTSVVDLGCGYFAPYENVDWHGATYIGIDVVGRCISDNARYASAERSFVLADWSVMDNIPRGDLAICKDVLQHWCHADVCRGLDKLSTYRYCLITNSVILGARHINRDIKTGDVRPLDLLIEPYSISASEHARYDVPTNPEPDVKLTFLWEPRLRPFSLHGPFSPFRTGNA